MGRHCLTGHAEGMECWRPWHDDFPNSGWREGNHNYRAWSRHPYSLESSLWRGLKAIPAVCCPGVSSLMLCAGPGGSLRLCQDPERWVWRGMRGLCTPPRHSVAVLRACAVQEGGKPGPESSLGNTLSRQYRCHQRWQGSGGWTDPLLPPHPCRSWGKSEAQSSSSIVLLVSLTWDETGAFSSRAT